MQSPTESYLSAIPTSTSKDIVHANTVCWKEGSSNIIFLYSEICMALQWLSSDGITFQFLDSVIFFKLFFSPTQHEEHNTTPTNTFCFMIHLSPELCTNVESSDVTEQCCRDFISCKTDWLKSPSLLGAGGNILQLS